MSAAGRNKEGRERDPFDFFPTPKWCVDRLLEARPHFRYAPRVLEPCAGDGAILRALAPLGHASAIERQPRFGKDLIDNTCAEVVVIDDALRVLAMTASRYDLGITNPSYSIAFPLLQALYPHCAEIVLLLRLSFLASEERSDFMRRHTPELLVLPNRPIFKFGTSDNCDYAWFRWAPGPKPQVGLVPGVHILESTPLEERRRDERAMWEGRAA